MATYSQASGRSAQPLLIGDYEGHEDPGPPSSQLVRREQLSRARSCIEWQSEQTA
jgi:hypothetical protein